MNNAIKISILLLSDYFDDDTDTHTIQSTKCDNRSERQTGRQAHIQRVRNDTTSILFHRLYLRYLRQGICVTPMCVSSLPHIFASTTTIDTIPDTHTCCSLFLSPNFPVLLSSTALQRRRELVYMYTPLHPHLVIQTNRCEESFEMRRFEYRHPNNRSMSLEKGE